MYLFGIAILFTIGLQLKKFWKRLKQRIDYLKTIEHLVENSKDIIYYCEVKPEFKYRYISPAIETLLSPTLIEDSMKNPRRAFEIIHPDDYHILVKKEAGELDFSKPIIQRWRNDDGEYICFEEYATPIYKDGKMVALQGIIRNINDKVILQQQLEYRATHDSLTDLHNREHFETQVGIFDKAEDVPIAIVICDVDELKYVNDTYGHKVGDQLIKETAILLKEFATDDVIVARIGGDEFAIILVQTNPQYVEWMLDEIQLKIDVFNHNEGALFEIELSKGYAFSHSSIGKMDELFVKADNEMYKDKNNKRTHLLIG
ncbi:hypothetical protein BI350_03710 [Sporosarcina ureilytica]|uniref:GGDEF domain-containing protein n=2 Tax=Sporosarcina ureilytica TaxID=298596 RepID=A0A1D8JK29_9BACL|nr:hypothetical protein BI350_03710 [Sporosarcina ureilytica]